MPEYRDKSLSRVDCDLWKRANLAALKAEKALTDWVQEAIAAYLKKAKEE